MLPRTPELLLLFAVLSACSVELVCSAQQPQPLAPLRFHFGDDPGARLGWANPNFDDGAWPEGGNDGFPAPDYDSDGFFWVRSQIAVPASAAGTLAIESQTLDAAPHVQEVWVNGRLVGRYGNFPPDANPLVSPKMLVFDLPAGVAVPGSMAVIALRTWNAPDDRSESLLRRHPDPVNVTFSIGGAPLLHALAAQDQDRAWLRYWPKFTFALVFILLGLAVLALGIWVRERQLLLCALWLVALPAFFAFGPLRSLLTGASASTVYIVFLILNAFGMYVVVELTWAVQRFRNRIFRVVYHLCWIGLTVGFLCAATEMHSSALVLAGVLTGNWLLFGFNVIGSGANIAALLGRGRNRAIAAAMVLISVGYFLGLAGTPLHFEWLGLSFFTLSFYVCTLFIAVLLMRQTWTNWRKGESLRIEFVAAREFQQQLVPATLPAIAGWRMEAAYLSATDVGGDFYHVIEHDNATILLVGDVSGKGLKAAMTGLLTIGAASAVAAQCSAPAQLLARLNREMTRLQKGGFITCLCARIAADGSVTLANAGHLAPYHNGNELELDSGLPLGIIGDVNYAESTVHLTPGDTVTFLSDGVVEAQSPSGELFGFDRTRAMSTHSAEAIARAAQAHGQSDDITVLTLCFAEKAVPA